MVTVTIECFEKCNFCPTAIVTSLSAEECFLIRYLVTASTVLIHNTEIQFLLLLH